MVYTPPWAWGLAALAAACVVLVVVTPQHGAPAELLHLGMLTRMERGGLATVDRNAGRMEQLSDAGARRQQRSRRPTAQEDAAWAQQLVDTGSSYAERRTETDLVKDDRASYSARRWAPARAGFTSVLPESSSSADDSAYSMASSIQQKQDGREAERAYARSSELTHRPRAVEHTHRELAYRPRASHEPSSQADYAPRRNAVSSAVRETSASASSSASNWAGRVFENAHERQLRVRHGAREIQLAQVSPAEERMPANQRPVPLTSMVPEKSAAHDEAAWGWAGDVLLKHRLEMEHHKAMVHPKVVHAAVAAKPQVPLHMTAKMHRKIKLEAARRAIGDLHHTSQTDENTEFQQKVKEQEEQVKEVRAYPRQQLHVVK